MLAPMISRENLSLVSWPQVDVHLAEKLFRVYSSFPLM